MRRTSAEMRRDCGRTGRGICWKMIPDFRSRPRSRLQSRCAQKRASVGSMRRRVRKSCGVSPKVARKGDGNETLKGRPRAPPARAEHGIGIRRRASHVRDTADGTCRHEEVAARENDTSLSAAPSAIGVARDRNYATADLYDNARLAGRVT